METTRHFTATTYVVYDGATALHKHPGLQLWLPPGGHIQRDELPHEAALREVLEEIGLDVSLFQKPMGPRSDTARPLPEPATLLLEDITVHDNQVSHQHIDFIYFATATSRTIQPQNSEAPADAWSWVTPEELLNSDRFEPDVRRLALDAIEAVNPEPHDS